jgi:hypothetical protein
VPRSHDAPVASQDLDDDLSNSIVGVMHLDLVEMVQLGYAIDSLYGDDGEWTKGRQIVGRDDCFRRNARLCIPNVPMLK